MKLDFSLGYDNLLWVTKETCPSCNTTSIKGWNGWWRCTCGNFSMQFYSKNLAWHLDTVFYNGTVAYWGDDAIYYCYENGSQELLEKDFKLSNSPIMSDQEFGKLLKRSVLV